MSRWILVCTLVVVLAGRAGAQCCGDCSGDGMVTINDLIVAVNNALNNCGAPTPTPQRTSTPTRRPTATATPRNRCPFTFEDSGNNLCAFRGRYNRGCGNELDSTFTSNGATLIVAIDTMLTTPPVVLFAAQVDSPTSASLTGWSTNNFQTTHPTAGTIQLTDNGSQLVVFPNDPPFMILSCNFVQYTGAYTGSARTAGALDDPNAAAAFGRLRAWIEQPPPDLAAPAATR